MAKLVQYFDRYGDEFWINPDHIIRVDITKNTKDSGSTARLMLTDGLSIVLMAPNVLDLRVRIHGNKAGGV